MRIFVQFAEVVQEQKGLEAYERVIRRVLQEVGIVYGLEEHEEISVFLCGDARIQELNREYRGMDKPTDVLSFSLNEDLTDGEEELPSRYVLGDIIISLDTMHKQAELYGHSTERELAYLTVHGALHILGYDHMIESDKKEMRTEEEYVLSQLGYIREGEAYDE